MNIWLLHVGEDLPIDAAPRVFRYGHLAEALVRRGHSVTRWAATFHHFRKTQRRTADTVIEVGPSYDIRLVYARGYRRNVSLARVWSYRQLARRFAEQAEQSPPPDLIVSGIPSLEWCAAAAEYGERHGVPVVVDVRDLWPDIYLNALPQPLRRFGRWSLNGVYRRTRQMLSGATALAAVSQPYLDWGLTLAGRAQDPLDCVVPLGYDPPAVPAAELASARQWLVDRGVDPSKIVCLFAGSFERSYDMSTIIAAARIAQERGHHMLQFVLCGDGGKMAAVLKMAAGLNNVVLTGWLNGTQMAAALSLAQVGLAAYSADALQSLPNKVFEYLAGKLAVVSSLRGEVEQLLANHECGLSYPAGDAAALAGHLTALAADRTRLGGMQENAHALWEREFRCCDLYDGWASHLAVISAEHRVAHRVAA